MIFGIGIDLTEISRIEQSMAKFPERFEKKIFTETEREYCRAMPVPAQHFAARFTAKEAFLKALGTGKSHGIGWRDMSIRNLPSGQPVLVLAGKAAEITAERGVTESHVSLSHSRGHAVAVVVLEKADSK